MSSKPPQSRSQRSTAIPSASTLSAIHTTFHLVFVRNKNQHSHAKWWKHLSMLRRSLRSLLNSVQAFEKYVDNEGIEWDELRTDDKGKIVDSEGEIVGRDEKVVEQGRYLAKWIVPGAYLAFSTVVADTQFSALGVVLLAALAQLAEAIKDFKTPDEVAAGVNENQSKKVETAMPTTPQPVVGDKVEDIGEPIVRRPVMPELKNQPVDPVGFNRTVPLRERNHDEKPASTKRSTQPAASESQQPESMKKKVRTKKSLKRPIFEDDTTSAKAKSKKYTSDATRLKKRKKKERNAIDDIFDGL